MECYGTQNSAVEWESILETSNQQLDEVNQKIQNLATGLLGNFISQYNTIDKQEWLLAVNWPEGSPYTEEQIDHVREAAQKAKEKAKEHIANSWEALGNYNP